MTVDVRVRRCSLTVRRRTGWSWGAGPEPYVEAALAGLEAALESALAEAGVDPAHDVVVDTPVRLEIGSDGVVSMASWTTLVDLLREIPGGSAGRVQRAGEGSPPETLTPPAGDAHDRAEAEPAAAGAGLGRLLARWSETGQLERIAAAWPEQVLREWLAAIADPGRAGAAPLGGRPAALPEDAVALIADTIAAGVAPPASERAGAERLLVLLGALAAALGGRLPDRATQALARARVDDHEPPVDAPAAADPDAASAVALMPGSTVQRGTAGPLTSGTAQLVPALPLLVLAALARIGYVDAVAVAAEVAALPGGGAALGAALAGKTLPTPRRGWDRTPAEASAIALAAARPPEWVPAALSAVALREDALLPPLASALQAAYAAGRSTRDEVVVSSGAQGLVCGETDGLLPVAWVWTEAELDAVLRSLGDPPVRRGDEFIALSQALGEQLALPRTGAAALERHLGAAVGTGLALLAIDLWGREGAEVTSPLMALERLADLEARVQPTAAALAVGIPRGQRWLDLKRCGLLDWFAVPWMPGGRLEIVTW